MVVRWIGAYFEGKAKDSRSLRWGVVAGSLLGRHVVSYRVPSVTVSRGEQITLSAGLRIAFVVFCLSKRTLIVNIRCVYCYQKRPSPVFTLRTAVSREEQV